MMMKYDLGTSHFLTSLGVAQTLISISAPEFTIHGWPSLLYKFFYLTLSKGACAQTSTLPNLIQKFPISKSPLVSISLMLLSISCNMF
jgi:hypothetical protein